MKSDARHRHSTKWPTKVNTSGKTTFLCPNCGHRTEYAAPQVLARLFAELCVTLQVDPRDLAGPRRDDAIVQKRWQVAWALRQAGAKLEDIGALLNRHHASIIHGLNMMARQEDALRRNFRRAWQQNNEAA